MFEQIDKFEIYTNLIIITENVYINNKLNNMEGHRFKCLSEIKTQL